MLFAFFFNEVGMLNVCCLFLFQNTRLDRLLVWILLSGSSLFVSLSFLNSCFGGLCSSLARNKSKENQTWQKPQKSDNAQKQPKNVFQFAQLCSQIVF